ncbi:hypothetical protein BS47DRAFT_1403267 [Hydnum rufescens UP504]|uniref:Uncharacterized protein n=1 Tax=Hydnum rufescens UP504 TaxID=1448309 RepID=A0A9P6DDU0_9AGAM|nr:hypothetical protein BS47DRAFT_1403267 [Hydnum rufescens UP504]
MAKPGPTDLCLKTCPRTFPDPTFELTRNPVEGKHGPKPNPEPLPGLLNRPKPNLDSTELTLVDLQNVIVEDSQPPLNQGGYLKRGGHSPKK